MANNLTVIYSETEGVNVTLLADAVYKVLGQNEQLFAELSFVLEDEIRYLNNTFRSIDKVTDVLSFPSLDGIRGKVINKKNFPLDTYENGVFIGSIAVCTERAKQQAKEYGHTVERELTYLICHGLLHLMGYDHLTEEDKAQMRALEEEIMNEIKVIR